MDFFRVATKEVRGGALDVYPDFVVCRSKDLMIRGSAFYAIWNEESGLWSRDEFDVQRIVDQAVIEHTRKLEEEGFKCNAKLLESYETNRWNQFRKYLKNVSDNYTRLDDKLTFANTEVKKSDYVSKRLPYDLAPGNHSAWDEMIGRLYKPEEKEKIEWAIGAVVSGDSKRIQKFVVLYGPPGHGKGTVIDILLKLFEGYVTTFDAKSLVGGNNNFATEKFRNNPLVAIQHDGDLSRIEDNTKLNSIISHEMMTINEKHKPTYDDKIQAFLFMGTNSPVKISDAKSGLIRRLIDVHPSGNLFTPNHYNTLKSKIDFELGAIAQHCLDVYRKLGRNYYSDYRPLEMMYKTDIFFNYVEAHYDIFSEQDGVTLHRAWNMYKEYCSETGINHPLPMYQFRDQLKNYFDELLERKEIDGKTYRKYFSGFSAKQFKTVVGEMKEEMFSLVIEDTTSLFDLEYADQPAQASKEDEFGKRIPAKRWSQVKTTLAEVDTSEIHFVKVPENHIVIDFDLTDDTGKKSLEKNLEAASSWPPTYAELSQGGNGVHLHYNYDGDVYELASVYSEGIEVKTLLGDASLRRRLTKCNDVPVATINSGLPLKEKKKVLNAQVVKTEKGLRDLIHRNLRKEIHPGTKPSIDFIHKILEDAYSSGLEYDVTDLRQRILVFANNSNNQAPYCLTMVQKMKFKSEEAPDHAKNPDEPPSNSEDDGKIVLYDLEVYPNLFVVCWKFLGAPKESIVRMINPSPQEIEDLLKLKLVGFYNRLYDNHILWARQLGYDLERLYQLSKKIVEGNTAAMFGSAYSISYTDIYDFSSKKQGLKKWQVELGIPHKEMDIPWDQPVPENRIQDVVDYCCNDVFASEEVFLARKGDFDARLILAELSGLTPNDKTAKHAARIIFNGDRNPQKSFVYTDLSKEFPGYSFDPTKKIGKSEYRGEDPSEGGYVYAEPGIYEDVVLLDVASMHPTSIIQLNLFGEDYTKNFKDLVNARLAIKNADDAIEKGRKKEAEEYLNEARSLFGGRLSSYLEDVKTFRALSDALKIVINTVYGLTSASFDNAFRDIRNKDNIVAKRGALFMIDLKNFVQEAGFQVAHIKTDSIKIPGATDWLIEQVVEFGKKYGYNFKHEATYDKLCLVNNAVYVARQDSVEVFDAKNIEGTVINKPVRKWTAVGAQFQEPYVYKTLFTGEDIEFEDLCVMHNVAKGSMYLDFNATKESAEHPEKMQFIGKFGLFVPVREGHNGGALYRVKDGKAYAVTGTKGILWVEADMAKDLDEYAFDMGYFEDLAKKAKETIEKFGSFEEFVS